MTHRRRAWMLAWLGGAVVGIGNGVAREATYGKRLDERTAHQISTGTAIVLFAVCFGALERRWPLEGSRDALTVGAVWATLTVAFEFGFGRTVARKTWSELIADYNLARGRLWPLVLLFLLVGPELARRLDG